MSTLEIRLATPADAEAIYLVHEASVRVLCAGDYTPEQVESWVRFRLVDDYRRALQAGRETTWAAVGAGRLVGYATYEGDELMALFVDPGHARRGAGRALLATVEAEARRRGWPYVTLQSAVNSQGFYERHGYVPRGATAFTLPDGVVLPCVRMVKSFRLADRPAV